MQKQISVKLGCQDWTGFIFNWLTDGK